MVRYHVRADGSMGVCTAREGNCPFGSEEGTRHFSSKTEAQTYSEERVKAMEAGKSLGSGFRKNLQGSKSSSGRSPITSRQSDLNENDNLRTAQVATEAYPGLDPSYDPEEYDAEDAKRLYDADLSIMKRADANVRAYRWLVGDRKDVVVNYDNMGVEDSYVPLYAQDSQGHGMVVPVPKQVKEDFKTAIGYVNQSVKTIDKDPNGKYELDKEFSTYFAKPESYVMVSDVTGKVDLSGLTRKVDPDSEEADKILMIRS